MIDVLHICMVFRDVMYGCVNASVRIRSHHISRRKCDMGPMGETMRQGSPGNHGENGWCTPNIMAIFRRKMVINPIS